MSAQTEFLKRVLEPPFYGWENSSRELIKPTHAQLWKQFRERMNPFADRRNWLSCFSWFAAATLSIPFMVFVSFHFSFWGVAAGFVYSMVLMGTHGTIYLHRYGSHRAYRFTHPFWLWIARNLVIKIIPEEIYVVSHLVHHRYSEQPGDPYNVHGGALYCFLADANHQLISRSLSEADYDRVVKTVAHMGLRPNSYAQYQRWGSIAHPARTIAHFMANWGFWYGAFYWIGGHALATAIFGGAAFWAFGVRTYNYDGHGRGRDQRVDGVDFHRGDLSVNQIWPGYVSGEWHNNHHLLPNSARSGFLPYQLDLAWEVIRLWERLGMASNVRDDKPRFEEFLRKLQETKSEPIEDSAGAVIANS